MNALADITSVPQLRPPRVLLYGPHGIGKTTFGAQASSPIVIQTEEGADSLNVPRFPVARSYSAVQEAVSTLYNEQHSYNTVVLDSIDWLEPLIFAATCDRFGNGKCKTIEDFGYGKGFLYAEELWREILAGLDALRTKGMAILLIGHAEIKRFDNPETDSYDRYQPKLHKIANALVQEWCDCIFFANYRTVVLETDAGFNKERKRGVGTGERVINTQERPAFIAKNRYNLPPELPLSWQSFMQALFPVQSSQSS